MDAFKATLQVSSSLKEKRESELCFIRTAASRFKRGQICIRFVQEASDLRKNLGGFFIHIQRKTVIRRMLVRTTIVVLIQTVVIRAERIEASPWRK